MGNKLKKYTIHILAIPAIDDETFYLPAEQIAIIVCTKRSNSSIYKLNRENILVMDFPDVEDKKYPGAFSRAHAGRIIRFIKGLSDDVTDIYVCCSKGGSRSPAIAAALLKMSGRKDTAVWDNPYYVPNRLVYLRLCREYDLSVTRLFVRLLTRRNRRAYKRAQKGKPCKYERWQIID